MVLYKAMLYIGEVRAIQNTTKGTNQQMPSRNSQILSSAPPSGFRSFGVCTQEKTTELAYHIVSSYLECIKLGDRE